ncbi:MAG: ABC transporter ATP-binding protein [Pseudomonadota bacterium]
MTSDAAPALRFEDVAFSYGGTGFALTVPKLEVRQGERLAIVGPSGSGKTTVLNLISGLEVPNAGGIEVDGQPVHTLSESARRNFRLSTIGFVFQQFELLSYLNALDNILYPYRLSPSVSLTPEVRDRAKRLAQDVGLGDKLTSKPAALSQGEQQRVAVCRALVSQPKLILADEATGNLDPDNKELILEVLFDQVAKAEATLVAVTHDHGLLPRFDRVIDFAQFSTRTGGDG